MKGGKPTPTKIKQLRGNPGKRKVNKDEPQYNKSRSDAPKELDAVGRKEWDKITKNMRANGVLTEVDETALLAFCQQTSIMVRAMKEMKKKANRDMVIITKSGYQQPNPYLGIINRAQNMIKSLGAELGLSPSSRTRVKATPTKPDDDKYAKMKQRRENNLIAAQQRFAEKKAKTKKKKANANRRKRT